MQSKNILKALICVSLVCGKSQTIRLLFNSRQTKPRWLLNLGDIANMVKAFVGSSYLNTAYGFKQSGVVVSLSDDVLFVFDFVSRAILMSSF